MRVRRVIAIGAAAVAAATGVLSAPAPAQARTVQARTVHARTVQAQTVQATTLASTIVLSGCSAALVRYPTSLSSDQAMMLTNGHCYEGGFLGAGEVLQNQTSRRSGTLLDSGGRVPRHGPCRPDPVRDDDGHRRNPVPPDRHLRLPADPIRRLRSQLWRTPVPQVVRQSRSRPATGARSGIARSTALSARCVKASGPGTTRSGTTPPATRPMARPVHRSSTPPRVRSSVSTTPVTTTAPSAH